MEATSIRLARQILDRELVLHRELLRMARLRHMLLRQGRLGEMRALYPVEARKVAEVRHLESMRGALAPRIQHRVTPSDLANATRRIGALIRRIGAVERASWALLARNAVRVSADERGLAVWTSI